MDQLVCAVVVQKRALQEVDILCWKEERPLPKAKKKDEYTQ